MQKMSPFTQRWTVLLSTVLLLLVAGILDLETTSKNQERPATKTQYQYSSLLPLGVAESYDYNDFSETQEKVMYDGDVVLNELDGDLEGHSIWMRRAKDKKVKAKYIAYKDVQDNRSVYSKYQEWKGGRKIILSCSGSYTNKSYKPTGITIDNGITVNRAYREDMDGLVIVYATGGIVVNDIQNRSLNVRYSSGGDKKSLNIQDTEDRYELFQWAGSEQATVFQTHLLAYDGELRINRHSSHETANRRLLVLGFDKKGTLYHIIYNIENSISLYNVAQSIFDHLESKDMKVEAMLNLDTGSFDILEAYDENRRQLPPEGDEPLSKAVNLIAYYYE